VNPWEEVAEPLSLKGLLDGALRSLRGRWRKLYPPFAIPLAFAGGAIPLAQMALTSPMAMGGEPSGAQILVPLIVASVAAILYGFAYAAMVVATTRVLGGEELSVGRAWLKAFDPRVIGTQILAFLATLVGLVFCIFPGIYVSLILSATLPVMIHERRYGVGALRRSVELMTHNPRRDFSSDPRVRVFLLYVAGFLIGYAVSFIIQLPLSMIMMAVVFRSAMSGEQPDPQAVMQKMLWMQVPSNMLSMLIQTVVFLYTAFGLALLYYDVLRRKEGEDLIRAAERLAPGPQPGIQ
jgi:hypothetical protein